ncbi:MAG: hypothetical protein P0Y62_05045 [Candidatus Chryseobacterium colombiense]|nr:hypothetical protein [Chryseobacterium sp.]WEK70922.1 MAG: hypothetical protein P0Y62_05045 [Chryseobacterium sp.]
MNQFFITLTLLFSILSYSQDFIFDDGYDFNKYNKSIKNYKVYQYLDNDSTNIKLTRTVKFDDKGRKIFESTNNYKFSKLTGIENYITNSFYIDSLLYKTETTYPNSINKYFSTFRYNSKKQLISITSKKFEKGFKTKYKRSSAGDLIDEEDFETKAKWTTDLKKYFEYDKSGRLIKTTIPEKFKKSQNIYYYYYLENTPIKITSYDKNRLVWDEYREYHNKNDYDYIRIWPDYDFKISEICRSIGKVSFKYDNQNNLIEISQPDYTGIIGNMKIRFSYSRENLLKKVEIISVDNQIELTSLYIYD